MLALCVLFTLPSFAQKDGVAWEHGTLAEALNKAKTNKKGPKIVFLDCFTTWCGPCKHMANTVFPTKEAGEYFNKNFVNIKIDMEKGEGIEIAKKYGVAAYPTFLILNADGSEIGRVVGGGDLNAFVKRVENAKDIKNSPKALKETFNADKSIDNAIAYLNALEESYMEKEMSAFLVENIKTFSAEKVFSADMWKYFSKNLSSGSELISYLMDNKNIADEIIGKDKVDEAIIHAQGNKLMAYLMGREKLSKEEVKESASTVKLLAKGSDKAISTCANIAELYSNGKIEEIAKLYNISNFVDYGAYEIQMVERAFGAVKEITAEQITKYYKEKEEFHSKLAEGCNGWRDMFIKSKEAKATK